MTSHTCNIDLRCYETLDKFNLSKSTAKPMLSEDKNGLDLLVAVIELSKKKPLVEAQAISPEKAPLRNFSLQTNELSISKLVQLRAFSIDAQQRYIELSQRDLELMEKAKNEGSLGKQVAYQKRSSSYSEYADEVKQLQLDSEFSLKKHLFFTGES